MRNTIAAGATISTLDRAMRILHAFSTEDAELSISDLSRRLGIHKSIVSRMVASLRMWRFLEQDPETKRIRIGPGAFQLGTLFVNREPVSRIAFPQLGLLVAQTRQSAHVAVLDKPHLLVVASVESPQALRVILRVGERRHLHATAAGKILLAYGRAGLLEEVVAAVGLPPLTQETITSRADLERHLLTVRNEGIAWNCEESTRGAGAVAAPIFAAGGAIAAALCTVFPLSVVDEKELTGIGERVREAARRISTLMGGTAPEGALPEGRR
ncbi:MAG TPA: IclR family transcriptional regulator [Methylomirabilota bacterium]|nr:IclR family transcriptional regulator [Methylomirabilota bacterium]